MRILLLRHGEPDYAIDGLTEKGKREAELLGSRLLHYEIREVYTSPLGRARETAEPYLRKAGKEAEVLPWLQEFRGRFPDPETGTLRVAWDIKPRLWDPENWADAKLFEGGNVREIWDETREGIDRLMARYGLFRDGPVWCGDGNGDFTIALFCHFAISMVTAGYLMRISPLVLLQRTLTHPTSLTELVTEERIKGESAFRMTRLGDLTHLEAAGEPRSMYGIFPQVYTGIDSTDPTLNHNKTLRP